MKYKVPLYLQLSENIHNVSVTLLGTDHNIAYINTFIKLKIIYTGQNLVEISHKIVNHVYKTKLDSL